MAAALRPEVTGQDMGLAGIFVNLVLLDQRPGLP